MRNGEKSTGRTLSNKNSINNTLLNKADTTVTSQAELRVSQKLAVSKNTSMRTQVTENTDKTEGRQVKLSGKAEQVTKRTKTVESGTEVVMPAK